MISNEQNNKPIQSAPPVPPVSSTSPAPADFEEDLTDIIVDDEKSLEALETVFNNLEYFLGFIDLEELYDLHNAINDEYFKRVNKWCVELDNSEIQVNTLNVEVQILRKKLENVKASI
jgi:hypothetical protein